MRFAIKFSDIMQNQTKITEILASFKNDVCKIYVIFDNVEDKAINNLDYKKKYVEKCKNKLHKINIPYDIVIVTNETDLSQLYKRNYIDIVLTTSMQEQQLYLKNEFISTIDISEEHAFDEIKQYINNQMTPFSINQVLTLPSKDKVWMKYYNQKALTDLKRFSLQKMSMYERIQYNNQDFLQDTAIEICDTDTSITYAELIQNVEKYKSAFEGENIQKNDKVAIMVPNVLSGIYSIFALQDIGAIPSLIHVFTKTEVLHNYLVEEKCQAIVMIGMQEVYDVVKNAIPDTQVKRVISVPLTDSLSFKYKLGIQLLTSKFGKFVINTINHKGKYKLNKNQKFVTAIKNTVTQLFSDFKNTSGNFKLEEDHIFQSLDNFLKKPQKIVESTPNNIAVTIHTGGSTATPKAALLTHDNLNANIDSFEATIQNFKRGETMVTIPPLFHVLGFNNCIYLPLRSGIKIVLVSKYNKKKVPKMFQLYHPEYFFAVPKIGRDMLNENSNGNFQDIDMSNLKYIVFGGEEMDSNYLNNFKEFLQEHNSSINPSQSLGATEASCSMTNTFNNCNVLGSLGIPLIGFDFKVVKIKNEEDMNYDVIEELGYNEVGELCFSGDAIMLGYLQEKFNKGTLRKHEDGKIWLHTADSGYIDTNGLIYFEDRIKDMVKINGEQVYTSEIKKMILSYPLVDKCVITCITDEIGKKKVIATITIKNNIYGYSNSKIEEDIMQLCRNSLIKEAVPREIVVKEILPETMYYKVDTNLLADEYEQKQRTIGSKKVV